MIGIIYGWGDQQRREKSEVDPDRETAGAAS
jgi:hypothetical protein